MTRAAAEDRDVGRSGAPDKAPQKTAAEARAARTRLLLEAPIAATLLRLAAPNVLAMFATAMMSIAEGAFAGQMGIAALAGLAIVFPFVMLTQMLSAGAMGGAISAAVARALGAKDPNRAGRLVAAAWVIAALAALFSLLIVLLFGRLVFSALSSDQAAVEAALDYALVFFPGCILVWLCHSSLSIIRGSGDMMRPSLVLLLVALASIPLAGGFGLGWGPLPALGMQGLALGPILAHGLGALFAIGYLVCGRGGITVRVDRMRASHFMEILRVGVIASLNAVQTVLTIIIMVGLVGRYGEAALAGYGLGARLEFLMIPIVFGMGAAMTAMVGANIGAGNRSRALKVGWTGSLLAAAIVGAIGISVALVPSLWLDLFLQREEAAVWAAGAGYFHIVAPFYALFAVGLAFYFASQGAGRMLWPVTASVLRMIVAIGGAVLLTGTTDLGIDGVFIAIAAGQCSYGLFTMAAIYVSKWR